MAMLSAGRRTARLSKLPLASRGGGTGPTGIVWCLLLTGISAHQAVWFSVSEMAALAWTREDTYLEMARRPFLPAILHSWPQSEHFHSRCGMAEESPEITTKQTQRVDDTSRRAC